MLYCGVLHYNNTVVYMALPNRRSLVIGRIQIIKTIIRLNTNRIQIVDADFEFLVEIFFSRAREFFLRLVSIETR